MSLLTVANYDPAAAVTKSTATVLAMTALDTTNLRVQFTPPASGIVLVRLRGVIHGSTSSPQIFLGVLDGATVVRRMVPTLSLYNGASSSALNAVEAVFVVTGLNSATTYTWDAAYGVETVASSSAIKYGGPDDAVANNAFGPFVFEVWTA